MNSTNTKDEVVWVLTIDHRHGTDITVHGTEESAQRALLNWVELWWEDDGPGRDDGPPMPSDPTTAIHDYFEDNETEFYTLSAEKVVY